MKKYLTLVVLIPLICQTQEPIFEEIELYNDSILLTGTLSYPKTDKALPLAIFIPGSGNPDRNGNQGEVIKANYIQLLADSLNTRDIAFYRYDKRNSNPRNTAKLKNIKIEDFVKDVKTAITRFQSDERFSSIHLIGHSQGSLVGMLASSDSISSFVSLAGAGTTIDKILIAQISRQNTDLGKVTEAHFEELIETDTILKVNPFLMAIFAPKYQKYLKGWSTFDPREELKKLDVPVLLINGGVDSQVTTNDARELKKAHPNSKLVIIPEMNHIFKVVHSLEENQRSYTDPNFPISTELITTISEFILSHG